VLCPSCNTKAENSSPFAARSGFKGKDSLAQRVNGRRIISREGGILIQSSGRTGKSGESKS